MADAVRIVEVGARDGLQNEPAMLSPAQRVAFIERLAAAGLTTIEAGSFVSPRWVPQMAGTDQVLAALGDRPDLRLPVLVPNLKGLEAALAAGAREVALFLAASESFSQKNINCSVAESIDRARPVAERALAERLVLRGYVSCVLGCPYEGQVPVQAVVRVVEALERMGCAEISLGDTIGTGTPGKARALVQACAGAVPADRLAVHFHDTYGQALANIYAALEDGVRVVDAAAGGLGGCPYARGASGNVATEAVVYMLDGMGVETGVAMEALLDAVEFAAVALGRAPASAVWRARRGTKG